jgi:hypothetical protein
MGIEKKTQSCDEKIKKKLIKTQSMSSSNTFFFLKKKHISASIYFPIEQNNTLISSYHAKKE